MVSSEEFVGVLSLLSHYTRKLEMELRCPSCSNILRMPTVLPCNHIFCSQCLLTKDKYQYKCPICMSVFLQADLKHSIHIEEMISIFKNMYTSLTAMIQKLHSQISISGRETTSKKNVDLGTEHTEEKMSSMGSPVAEHNDTLETLEGMEHPLPTHCPVSGHKNTEEISQVSQAMKELSNESHVCCHNSTIVKSSGPCFSGEQLHCCQFGVAGMKVQPGESTLPSNDDTRRNLQEDTKGYTLGGPQKDMKTEAEVMLPLPETSNSEIQHTRITNDANSCLPTYPPDAGCVRKSKRQKLGSKLDTNPNNLPIHTRHTILDDKTEAKESIKANTSSLSQINFVSPRHCIPEDKCNELRMAALGVCSDWMLCGSDLSTSEEEILLKFASLTGSSVTRSWKNNTTHVIVSTDVHGACSRTLKVLRAILKGKWVLTIEWIKACMKDGHLVPEEGYEIRQVGLEACSHINGPKRGRLNAINKAPKIFSGLRFYFSDYFEPVDRGILEDLVIDAGGTVLQRDELTCSRADSSSLESSYFVVNEGYQEKWSKFKRQEAVMKRGDEAVDMKLKTGFQVIGHTRILDTIAACNSASDLAKCVILLQ